MRAAVLQMTAGTDPAQNLRILLDAMDRAHAGGADILFTPEMSGCLDRDRRRAARSIVSEHEDIVLTGMRERACALGLWVAIGSLAVREGDTWRNRAFLIDDRGEVRARYDKIHLFDATMANGETYRESASYTAGASPVLARTPSALIGLSICYDLRFPDLYRALSDAGADILSVPAAFTVETGKAHWHALLRARAIEAGCFVIAAAQTGRHADGRETYGHGLVVDPWGEVLLDMGVDPGIAIVDVDMDRICQIRARIPALDHRRPISPVTTA